MTTDREAEVLADAAKRIKSNPAWPVLATRLKSDIISQWLIERDPGKREALWYRAQELDNVLAEIESMINEGDIIGSRVASSDKIEDK